MVRRNSEFDSQWGLHQQPDDTNRRIMTDTIERVLYRDPDRQSFAASNGKVYYKVTLLVEASEAEYSPESWKWDAIMHPSGAKVMAVETDTVETAATYGLVKIENPQCEVCQDRGYV